MAQKDMVIVGAGGLGREVMWQLCEADRDNGQYHMLGFVDDDPALSGKDLNGFPVLGAIQWLADYPQDICAAVCIANPRVRKKVVNQLKANPNIHFPTIMASDVKCSPFVTFGEGCIICLSTVITVNIAVGDFAIVDWDTTIGHDSVLEDFVTLYPSVNVSGNVHIGSGTEIGVGANIIQGKRIGENAIIGAGAVVVKDIPANCTAVGVPAVPIKYHIPLNG